MKKILIPALFIFTAPWAYGDYTVEFGPKISSLDSKSSSSEVQSWFDPFLGEEATWGFNDTTKGESDYRTVSAVAYFGRVDDSGVPLAEAGFLSKLGSFSIDAGTMKSKTRTTGQLFVDDTQFAPDTYTEEEDGAFIGTDLLIVTRGTALIFGGGLDLGAYQSESAGDFGVEAVDTAEISYRLHAGIYYNERGAVLYTYENSETELEFDYFNSDRKTSTKTHKISWRQLLKLPASQHLALSAGYEKSELDVDAWSGNFDSKYWHAGLDYYPISNLQLGISTSETKGDGSETVKGLSYHLKYFFTPRMFAEATLAEFKSSETMPALSYRASGQNDLLELAFGLRF